MEPAGRRDSACKDSWELQNSSPTPTIGALSPVELKPASGIFDVLIQIQIQNFLFSLFSKKINLYNIFLSRINDYYVWKLFQKFLFRSIHNVNVVFLQVNIASVETVADEKCFHFWHFKFILILSMKCFIFLVQCTFITNTQMTYCSDIFVLFRFKSWKAQRHDNVCAHVNMAEEDKPSPEKDSQRAKVDEDYLKQMWMVF